MKKALTPILAVIAVAAIVFCFVFNGQKGNLQKSVDDLNAQIESVKAEAEAKAADAEAVKTELETKLADAEAAKAELESKVTEAEAKVAEADAVKTELEGKVADLEKQLEDAVAAAAATVTEAAEEVAQAAEEKVEEAAEAAAEAVEEATEAASEVVEAVTETVEEAVEEAAVMSHADYIAAEEDTEVVIESYVQATQSWWDNKITVYLQDADGAYFVYNMAATEEDAAKLVPGAKIRVTGYKTSWAGEVEIAEGATFEFVEADPYIAEATDVTAILASDELADHMNELVSVKGATVVAQEDGTAFAYKNPEEKTDDLYFAVDVDGATYNFCVEFYLTGKDTDVYKAVEGLNVGDVIDLEGFLYWYNGANLQATSVTVK